MAQTRTRKTTSTKNTRKNTKKSASSDFTPLIIIVLGLIWAALLYIPSGLIGPAIKEFFMGLLGRPVFVLPIVMIVYGFHMAVGKGFKESKKKYYLTIFAIAVLSAIFTLFSIDPHNPFTSFNIYWYLGKYGMGGGVIGGILCDIFANLLGSIVAGIILFTILIMIIMIITKWSPLKALLRVIVRLYLNAKKAQAEAKDEIEEIKHEEQMSISDEPVRKTRKQKMQVFTDDDIVPKDKKAKKVKENTKSETIENKEDVESKTIDAEKEIMKKPYDDEDYIPPSLREVVIDDEEICNLDDIVDNAVPILTEKEKTSYKDDLFKSTEEISGVTNKESITAKNSFSDLEEKNDEVTESKELIPEKVTGMEDVTEEIEQAFERIPYTYPDIRLLNEPSGVDSSDLSRTELKETAQKLVTTLKSFNVEAKLINVSKGPTVTRYELKPGEGVKVSKIVNLSDDIALRLAASGVRIEAPIPGKEAIGIEIPNKTVDTVFIRDVIGSNDFKNYDSKLAFALGKDITGKNIIADIGKMPHVLIAGSTGSGKSVCINTLITSIIYKADPNEVKLLMVDPKVVELGVYNGIPHLLIPVVTDPRRASGALYWAVQEMLRRYQLFADGNVRDIKGYNAKLKEEGLENLLPHIVIIIDELADLMMVAPGEVEDSICRLAQMARAAGMHLVIATQRPSVDVITGTIKANIPSRIAFAVSSQIDSRTILDQGGADKLLGKGDMLFAPIGASKPIRLQGAFISDKEVERVVDFIKGNSSARYDEDIIEKIDNGKPVNINENSDNHENDADELLPRAIEIAVDTGKISASYIQRRLKVGFSRAARIIDQMEERGLIGPQDGSKPREVLITKEDYMEMSMRS